MIATTTTTRRRVPGQSTAFRAALADEIPADVGLFAAVLTWPWNGQREIVAVGSRETAEAEARQWHGKRGYCCIVKPIGSVKLAA